MTAIVKKAKTTTLAARVERAAQMAYVEGAGEAAISKALGVKAVTVRDWKKRPEWDAAVERLRRSQEAYVLDRLANLTVKATQAVEECLDSENDAVRLKAAQWVLERGTNFATATTPWTQGPGLGGEVERFMRLVAIDVHQTK
ncbi:MAG TPA: hypothetical protein VMW57_05535 [Methyloceanibacter sp.]|nr:hypothetical protein [Methyloceanibacter sp.]